MLNTTTHVILIMVNDMNYEDIKTPEELLQYMNDNFRYGFIAEDGTEYNMDDPDKFTENFTEKWRLLNPDRLRKLKVGNCWDQVEFERKWFFDNNIEFATLFVMFMLPYENTYTTHTYLLYRIDGLWNYFEHADSDNRGITYGFKTFEEAIQYQTKIHIENNKKYYGIKDDEIKKLRVYDYHVPRYHLTAKEYMDFIFDECSDVTGCLLDGDNYDIVPK